MVTRVKPTGFSSPLFSNDTTQAGYSLGMPEGRSTAPSPERSLSPAACCLVRALMHSALLWASCNNEVCTVDNVYMPQLTFELCDFPECHGGADPACQGGYPSSRPPRVLLAPPGARRGAAREGDWQEHGRVCYHHPPCVEGDSLKGATNM